MLLTLSLNLTCAVKVEYSKLKTMMNLYTYIIYVRICINVYVILFLYLIVTWPWRENYNTLFSYIYNVHECLKKPILSSGYCFLLFIYKIYTITYAKICIIYAAYNMKKKIKIINRNDNEQNYVSDELR